VTGPGIEPAWADVDAVSFDPEAVPARLLRGGQRYLAQRGVESAQACAVARLARAIASFWSSRVTD